MAATTKKTTTTRTSSKTKTEKLTPFEQEKIEILKKIYEYNVSFSSNFVFIYLF